MKQLLNWRQLTLYALSAGCFFALLMLHDETENSIGEFVATKIEAVALMLACGYPLCKLTRKWEKEGKVKRITDNT